MMVALQSSLGIQFTNESLLLVHLKRFVRQTVIDQYAFVNQPSAGAEDKPDEVWAQEISRFIQENNISRDNVWVGLPRHEFLLRFITLPATAEENLHNVLRYEMGKYIPFPPEEMIFDFLVTERDSDAKTIRLLLVATKKEVPERYLSILERCGITPQGMETSTTSLLNSILLEANGTSGRDLIGVVDIGARTFEMQWIVSGRLRYSRSVEFLSPEVSDRRGQVTKEIRDGFRAAFPGRPFPAQHREDGENRNDSTIVYLTAGDEDRLLLKELAKTEEISVVPFSPGSFSSPTADSSGSLPSALAAGIGLALKGIKKVPWDSNLLPRHLRKKRRRTGLYLAGFLGLAVVLLSLAWGISAVVRDRIVVHGLEKEIAALKPDVLSVQQIQQEAETIAKEIESLNALQQADFSKLAILKELSALLPPSVWLSTVRCYKNELQLTGYADSASDLIALLDGSSLFYASEFTAPITRDREGKESFKIKTKITRR